MKQRDADVARDSQQRGFELRDASALGLTLAGLGILLLVLAAMGGAWLLYTKMSGESPVRPGATGPWSYDQGNLQLIRKEQVALQQQYEQHLMQYGWVDQEQGVARIPIEEAMRIVAEEGLPQWGEPNERTLIEEIYRNASER